LNRANSYVRNANVYFDGDVTSRTIKFSNGELKSLTDYCCSFVD